MEKEKTKKFNDLNKGLIFNKIWINFKSILKNMSYILLVLLLVNILSFSVINNKQYIKSDVEIKSNNFNTFDTLEYTNNIQTDFNNKLVIEVEKYIKTNAPRTKLSAKYLVDKCLEYNTDVVFVLSQGLLESHFGTKGKAAQTNSVWNVGTYDNGQIKYRYKHPNESVEPYLKLLNEKYLIDVSAKGDTVYKDLYHLLEDHGYVNYNGNRFATSYQYENSLRKIMLRINSQTNINFYQEILRLTPEQLISYFGPYKKEENIEKLYAQK